MNDLKKYMKVSEELLENSFNNNFNGIGKLKCISKDINYWKKLFKYDSSRSYLENFLLYRIAGAFNLYNKGEDDADILPQVMVHLKNNLLKISSVEDVILGKDINEYEKERAFLVKTKNGESFYLESDVANSLMTEISNAFRYIFIPYLEGTNVAEKTYIKEYNLELDEISDYYKPFRYFYYYSLFSRLKESKDEFVLNKIKELEIKATYTHTLKNMIVVPYNYNRPRGFLLNTYSSNKRINDDLELTIKDYKEMLEDESLSDNLLGKRLKSKKSSVNSIKFILDNLDFLYGDALDLYNDLYAKK